MKISDTRCRDAAPVLDKCISTHARPVYVFRATALMVVILELDAHAGDTKAWLHCRRLYRDISPPTCMDGLMRYSGRRISTHLWLRFTREQVGGRATIRRSTAYVILRIMQFMSLGSAMYLRYSIPSSVRLGLLGSCRDGARSNLDKEPGAALGIAGGGYWCVVV